MKVKDILKSLEGIDPELEVFEPAHDHELREHQSFIKSKAVKAPYGYFDYYPEYELEDDEQVVDIVIADY